MDSLSPSAGVGRNKDGQVTVAELNKTGERRPSKSSMKDTGGTGSKGGDGAGKEKKDDCSIM